MNQKVGCNTGRKEASNLFGIDEFEGFGDDEVSKPDPLLVLKLSGHNHKSNRRVVMTLCPPNISNK